MTIAKSAVIHPNVEIGEGTIIEDFCVIGCPPRKLKDGELKTIIGKNCHFRSHSVIYAGNVIGDGVHTGNMATIREQNHIGNNVSIGTKADIQHHVRIEDNVRIHSQAFIPELSVLKRNAIIGPNVVLTNDPFPRSKKEGKLKGVVVEEDAIVGANATVLPGITIGRHALVGAGAVVTKDVPAETVVVGNPALPIKKVHELRYKTGEKAY